jgi:nucleoside-diphosphate-sugar epimerase
MKILVTGGTGFTGKALVKRLLDDGHQVVAMDYKEGHRTDELHRWGARVVIGTVTDREAVRRSMAGVEVVQHLAAAFRELDVPESHYDHVNVDGTRICLEEAKAVGVKKFIYCSTCGIHGNVKQPPTDEEHNIAPADYYQSTKYKAEPVCLEFMQRTGMPVTIIRPSAIYGPGDPERFYMIFKRVARGRFPMFGNGKTLYHPLYIDNLVDALVLAMNPKRGGGQAYLIADAEYVPIEDLVRRVGRSMGVDVRIPHFPLWPLIAAGRACEKVCKPFHVSPPIFPRRVDWYRQNRAFNIGKARRDLGYEPKVGLDEGLRRTFEWYRAEGML